MMLTIAAVVVVVLAVLLLFPAKPGTGERVGRSIDSIRSKIASALQTIDEEADVLAEEYRRVAQEQWKQEVRQKAAATLGKKEEVDTKT